MTLLECYAQVLIDLWLADGDLEVDGATYKQHVAAVIKEAKEEAILEIEKRLGCDIQTAVDRLEHWEEDFEGYWKKDDNHFDLERSWEKQIKGWDGETYKIARQP